MASRIIMRVELSSAAKREFENVPETFGMTQLAVTNKLLLWFQDQSEELRASILGWYPGLAAQDITTTVLKRFITDARRSDRRRG